MVKLCFDYSWIKVSSQVTSAIDILKVVIIEHNFSKLCFGIKEKEKFFRLHNLGHSLILAMQGVSKVHSDLFASSVSLNSYFTYLSKN